MAHFYTDNDRVRKTLEPLFTTSPPQPKLGWKHVYIFDDTPTYRLDQLTISYTLEKWLSWYPSWRLYALPLMSDYSENASSGQSIYLYCDMEWYYVHVYDNHVTFSQQNPPLRDLEHGDVILCPGDWNVYLDGCLDQWLEHAKRAKAIEDSVALLTHSCISLRPYPLTNDQLIEKLKDVLIAQLCNSSKHAHTCTTS